MGRYFDERVAPILSKRCLGCYNNELNDGGISFMDRDTLIGSGGRGPAIVPGNPAESVLIAAVRQDGELKMPPGAKLSGADIATLTEWIGRGALWGKPLHLPQETARLQPTAFREIPTGVARELQKIGCRVPQAAEVKEPHNVIRGEFARTGQTDWAVLCSKDGASTLLIFWNGSARNPSRIARSDDTDFFTRRITAAGRSSIVEHYHARGGAKPPPIDHQGIDDSVAFPASVIHYYSHGKWLELGTQ